MKSYFKPEIQLFMYKVENIIAASGVNGLINKGEGGKPASESYSSLFDNK